MNIYTLVLLGTAAQGEYSRNHKLQWTWLSSDPFTVDIFVGVVILDCLCSSGSHRRHAVSSILRIRQTKTSPSRSWWLTCILAVSVSCHVSCHMCTFVRLCGTYYAQIFRISTRSPLSFPPKNARVSLTTMRYDLASCKLLWHVCAFHRHATRILIKKSCSNILNRCYVVPKHTWWLTSLENTSNRS